MLGKILLGIAATYLASEVVEAGKSDRRKELEADNARINAEISEYELERKVREKEAWLRNAKRY